MNSSGRRGFASSSSVGRAEALWRCSARGWRMSPGFTWESRASPAMDRPRARSWEPVARFCDSPDWDEGVACSPSKKLASVANLIQPSLRWVGREVGLGRSPVPGRVARRATSPQPIGLGPSRRRRGDPVGLGRCRRVSSPRRRGSWARLRPPSPRTLRPVLPEPARRRPPDSRTRRRRPVERLSPVGRRVARLRQLEVGGSPPDPRIIGEAHASIGPESLDRDVIHDRG